MPILSRRAALIGLAAVAPAARLRAQADAPAGTARVVAGQAFTGGLLTPVRVGQVLRRNERVQTLAESACEIELLDGSRLVLGAECDVMLDAALEGGALAGRTQLVAGMLRFLGSRGRPKRYAVGTASATIGIRGTELDLRTAFGVTELAMLEGSAELQAGGTTRAVTAPETVRIEPGQPPAAAPPSPELEAAVATLERLVPSAARRRQASDVRIEELRGRDGRVVGRLLTRPDGRVEGVDLAGALRFRYDPRTNVTTDAAGRNPRPGDQVRALMTR